MPNLEQELREVLWGFENDRRWDSLGEAANEGVKFVDEDQAIASLLQLIQKERREAAKAELLLVCSTAEPDTIAVKWAKQRIQELSEGGE